ncbi:hypothetical protein BKA67DRAFT_656651 [Truncatella angustata]|uniref:Rhodopsin domain-containing protein n=1 Tax=Truncatella angustata TaxID=152316 RepID=A0A9P9A306_9PEZI|nr:uncharacterized protein BKA67DRAFT_656651 [Truncatella angustata]KAH6658460.1 hypothetical protein BKA67DRAFT_656651 [Truncatella angustata]
MASLGDNALYETTTELISEQAFKIVLWVGTGLCLAVCILRFLIRLVCFRRLLIEDYLVLGSMAILVSIAAVLQRFLADIYLMMHVQNLQATPGPDFPSRMSAGLRADGAVLILDTVGIWLIKLNFLVFFYRLGHQIQSYLIFWWIAFTLVIGCLAVLLGVIPYSCSFGSLEHIVVQCASESSLNYIYTAYKVSISIDVLSDVIIICFPVVIVWQTKINLRQKLVLTSIFLLVAFNIAVTIVRGSIFGNVYGAVQEANHKVLDTAWALFWFFMEYVVSFVIACIISFRSLWVSRKQSTKDREKDREAIHLNGAQQGHAQAESPVQKNKSWWQKVQNSLLNTMATLEGTTLDRHDSSFLRPWIPSPHMGVDFSKWGSNVEGSSTDSRASRSGSGSGSVPSTYNFDDGSSRTEVSRSYPGND